MGAGILLRKRVGNCFAFAICFLVLSSQSRAADFLEIENKGRSDLRREGRLITRLADKTPIEKVKTHQFAFTGNLLSVGKFQNTTGGQKNSYKMSALPGFNFEYSQNIENAKLQRFRGTIGVGYTRAYQEPRASHTVLSVFPIELFGEYMFVAPKRTFVPYAGVGGVAFYSVQRGESSQSEDYWQLVPALTVGVEWQTPWQWLLHSRVRETQNLKANTSVWSGEIYDLGVAYKI